MTDPITVAVCVKRAYGRTLNYPANDAARAIARIAGTDTLTDAVLAELAGIGIKVQVTPCQQ